MTELLTAILAARDRVLMLFILTIAVLLVTYIIYTISGRSGVIKYLPGFLLTGAGVYYLYRGLQQMTTHAGLNELMSSVMFIVIGLVGISFALILGIYHQGEGQKTKRRAQALDYLQEARSAEAVVYPKARQKTLEAAPVAAQPAVDPEERRRREEERIREETERLRLEEEQRLIREQQEAERKEKEEALRLAREQEARRIAEQHEKLKLAEAERFAKERHDLLTGIEKRREEQKLIRLEKELAHKNAIREEVIAYNLEAEALNQKENATFGDQFRLFAHRHQIRLKKWVGMVQVAVQELYTKIALGLTRTTGLATGSVRHFFRDRMTASHAKKQPEDTSSDSKAADATDANDEESIS